MRIPCHKVVLAAAACLLGPGASVAEPAAPARTGDVSLHGVDLEQSTIPQLQDAMDRHRISSVELTVFYLQRIARLNPDLNAVIVTSPTAILEAVFSDVRRATHQLRGPMDGIPVLLKDNVDTQIVATTAGSEALLQARHDRDAFLVRKLRAGGAVVLGKANLSEWANFRSFLSSSGWSGVGGQTNNPYVLDRNPCGSSSGSGSGIAANLATVAIGTETDGSIVCPSGANGIVGIKPTLGLVSRSGVVPISAQQDTAGPMARNVTDAAVMLSVIAGADAADPATADSAGHVARDYTRFLDRNALRGKRIGVWKDVTGGDPDTDAVFDQFIENLRRAGATPVEVSLPLQDVVGNNEFPALLNEFKHDLNAYLAATPGRHPADLQGLIDFNNAHADTELQFFQQEIFDLSQTFSGSLTDPDYLTQRSLATTSARRSIDETLAMFQLDAIAAPTNSPAWVTTLGEGDAFIFGSSGPAAVAGYPNVSVPAGFVGPLPVGVSLFASRWDEPKLISFAFAYEQATHARRAPQFLPTLPAGITRSASPSAFSLRPINLW
ncbi:MAG TPA: amidase [Kofleriaceae bacterium]|nr:amidase [Kofleriaceae bacterium]